jgi:hypothetical protein
MFADDRDPSCDFLRFRLAPSPRLRHPSPQWEGIGGEGVCHYIQQSSAATVERPLHADHFFPSTSGCVTTLMFSMPACLARSMTLAIEPKGTSSSARR